MPHLDADTFMANIRSSIEARTRTRRALSRPARLTQDLTGFRDELEARRRALRVPPLPQPTDTTPL